MNGAAASAANPMRVRELCTLNIGTLLEAFENHDTGLLRVSDGKQPSAAELAATTTEFEAARREMGKRAYSAENEAFAAARLEALTANYDPGSRETMHDLLPRMSESARAEARGLRARLAGVHCD